MPTILNNTERDFRGLKYVTVEGQLRMRQAVCTPGICKLSEEDYQLLKSDSHFQRACETGAVVVNSNGALAEIKSEITPVEVSAPKEPRTRVPEVKTRKKRKKRKDEFEDFE